MFFRRRLDPELEIDVPTARARIGAADPEPPVLLDVRQPEEYESGHLAGAVLMPLPELEQRWEELDPSAPTIVYCAVGGRSLSAVNFLRARGFDGAWNLYGGIRAWDDHVAFGPESIGLHLFENVDSLEDALVAAYGMEFALAELYAGLRDKVDDPEAKALFDELSRFEDEHVEAVARNYARVVGTDDAREALAAEASSDHVEGGLTAEQVLEAFPFDREDKTAIVSFAMQIEAQALDLYARAAERASDDETRRAMRAAASEEHEHLTRLSRLLSSP